MANKKLTTKTKVITFLKRTKKSGLKYGEVAKEVGSVPMAVGQIMKSLARDPETKGLCAKVVGADGEKHRPEKRKAA